MQTLPASWQRPPPTPGQDIPHQGRGRSTHSQVRPAAGGKFFLESSLPPRKGRASQSPTPNTVKPDLCGHIPWRPCSLPMRSDSIKYLMHLLWRKQWHHTHTSTHIHQLQVLQPPPPHPGSSPKTRERSCNDVGWLPAVLTEHGASLRSSCWSPCLMPPTWAWCDLGLRDTEAQFSTHHSA